MLDLQELNVDLLDFTKEIVEVHLSTNPKRHLCPCCNSYTSRVHDYRIQRIKHIMLGSRQSILFLNKRRYLCTHCGKKFYENYDFITRYYHHSNHVIHNVLDDFKRMLNFKEIALNNHVSSQTLIRLLKFTAPFKVIRELPEAIGIDEFRGNSGGNKFQVAITDLKTHKIVDIISSRSEDAMYHYLNSITNKEKVKYVTIDLSLFFKRIILDNFKNATIIADKFHYTRLINWALDKVRKKIQSNLDKEMRVHFKHSKYLLHKRVSQLDTQQYKQLCTMLEYSETLRWSYAIKEKLYEINDEENIQKKKMLFKEWLLYAQNCQIEEFNGHINTFYQWYKYIINSFETKYTNGITEGLNTKIKTLKRMSFGFRNFTNFRLRILACE